VFGQPLEIGRRRHQLDFAGVPAAVIEQYHSDFKMRGRHT
jgi:hypothetical protein